MQLAEPRNVLIVEDERVVAKDLQRTLINLGYEVPITVATADDAIRAAAERCPDLVLMDIRIKGARDGIETAEILKSRFDLPVVYLTAYADQQTVARAKTTAPYAYLLKPVKVDELRTAVEIALHKHDMERRGRERERWFATTLRSIGDAVISTDAAGCITLMNPMAETMTGWKTAEVRGRPLSEVVHLVDEATQKVIEDPVAEVLRAGKVLHVSGVLTSRGGQERVIADSAAPIMDEEGKLLGVVIVFRDVSESRRMERRLQFAERLASLGTLAAGVAHEINNPLSFVVANIDYALSELRKVRAGAADAASAGEIERALEEAQIGTSRVTEVVSELRAFARPSTAQYGRVDVNRVIAAAIELVGDELRSRARLLTDFGSVPAILANETRLGQVFMNLLVNAGQAVAALDGTGEVQIRSYTGDDGQAVVEVRDSGAGMSDTVRRQVFDPFFTTKEPGRGTGLGLAVCHGVVTSLGGVIEVQSREGHGSAFIVTLPAAPPEPVATQLAPAEGSSSGARVLVVDDEPMVRTTIVRMLAREYAITVADGGPQALSLVGAGQRFDVILSDVSMAGMSGIELHDALAAHHPDQARRMVFLSGGAFTGETIDFLRQMAHRHLEKPFALSQLRSMLAEQLKSLGPATS